MLRRIVTALLPLLLLLSPASRAHAQGLRFDYQAPANCPNLDAFRASVTRRFEDLKLKSIPNYSLVVRIAATADGYGGSLTMITAGDNAVERSITARHCDELVDALALVFAVVLNPEKDSTKFEQAAADRTSTNQSLPASALDTRGEPATLSPHTTTASIALVSLKCTRFELDDSKPNPWSLVAYLGFGMDRGGIPKTTWAPRLGIAVSLQPRSTWAASLGLSATPPSSRSVSAAGSVSGAVAKLRLEAFRFEGCGTFRVVSNFGLGPCALFEVGRLGGSSAVDSNVQGTRSWLAPGALLRGQWHATKSFGLYSDLGVTWPLVRSTFYFRQPLVPAEPVVVYAVPSRALTASLGAVMHF